MHLQPPHFGGAVVSNPSIHIYYIYIYIYIYIKCKSGRSGRTEGMARRHGLQEWTEGETVERNKAGRQACMQEGTHEGRKEGSKTHTEVGFFFL
jgi:hypothetical protein